MDGCLSVRTSWMVEYQFALHGWLNISSHFMDGCLSVRTSWMVVYQFALHKWLSISSHFMDGWLSVYQFTILLRVHVETKTLVQQQQQLSSHGPWNRSTLQFYIFVNLQHNIITTSSHMHYMQVNTASTTRCYLVRRRQDDDIHPHVLTGGVVGGGGARDALSVEAAVAGEVEHAVVVDP